MENNHNDFDFSYFEDDMPLSRSSGRKYSEDEGTTENKTPDKQKKNLNKKQRQLKRYKGRIIIISSGVLILALIIGLIVMIASISAASSDKAFEAIAITDTEVTFQWKPMKKTHGYHIYAKELGSKEYMAVAAVNEGDASSTTVSGLNEVTQYDFYITAMNEDAKEKKFGFENHVITLPSPPTVTAIFSETKGGVHIEWNPNDKADGYVIEYQKTSDISSDSISAQNAVISDPTAASYDLSGLEDGIDYTVLIASYLKDNQGDPQFGPPGEAQTVRIARANVNFTSGAQLYDNSIDPEKPMVAFTFDDGPFDGVHSDRILDALEKYGAKATFFMVGCYVEDHPENLKRKVALNMELGNHTWDHSKYGENISAEDIKRCSDAIFEVTGQYPTGFRPPGGAQGNAVLSESAAEGMAIYLWNVNSEDYETRNADSIYNMVMNTLKDGNIIGMHDTYEATAEAVERLIPAIQAQGYQIVSCHDLVVAKTGEEPKPGEIYSNFTASSYD